MVGWLKSSNLVLFMGRKLEMDGVQLGNEFKQHFWETILGERLDNGEVEMLDTCETVPKMIDGGRDGSENSFLANFINSSINNKVNFLCDNASSL